MILSHVAEYFYTTLHISSTHSLHSIGDTDGVDDTAGFSLPSSPSSVSQNPARERERKDLLKIQQEREREDLLKIQQEKERERERGRERENG